MNDGNSDTAFFRNEDHNMEQMMTSFDRTNASQYKRLTNGKQTSKQEQASKSKTSQTKRMGPPPAFSSEG